MMRILSVRQPWADAIIHGGKDVENRTQTLGPYTGPVAIHAAGEFDRGWRRNPQGVAVALFRNDHPHLTRAPRLARIIGVVNLEATHHTADCIQVGTACEHCDGNHQSIKLCSPWAQEGTYHLELTHPLALPEPIIHKGGLGLRNAAPDLEAAILAQLEGVQP